MTVTCISLIFLNGHLGHYYSNVELKCFIPLQIGIQKDEGNTSDIPLQVRKYLNTIYHMYNLYVINCIHY